MTSPRQYINGLRVSRETQERLQHFVHLFKRWQASINLIAPSTLPQLWDRHVADSLQIFHLRPEPINWVDLGSGGGFPGVITAIALAESGAGWVHLIESNNKKAAFLRVALLETGARGSVHPVRIEEASKAVPICDAISARALAELPQLLDFCLPWATANENLRAYFHKGRDYQLEIDKARGRFEFDLLKHQSVIEPDSVVLEVSRIALLSRTTG
ncbi:16S rRNA (guanine(527)-N(7))-methyltransferase [Xaviernesmea oryzae]|uniref:Ribosomal RNA small subunit methyltransferase G n=1 Tax=Xaviernesmea oryzae TaxID=464029 RepID=A0A1Q9AYA2_9HYPH|nr:16S rRNA (guanine(527)-N(7))-methyltransferase RsmG [Xaviernesmea oryzae]OLP60400.1 16S rRNA (guanine(527)-N(7))-methyltransferase [Xaviernesmea oryzae]SEK19976.1 16S rRNA (guanine527-N7)-methyltransferase [Xaviernesmea oryzae]